MQISEEGVREYQQFIEEKTGKVISVAQAEDEFGKFLRFLRIVCGDNPLPYLERHMEWRRERIACVAWNFAEHCGPGSYCRVYTGITDGFWYLEYEHVVFPLKSDDSITMEEYP